MINGSALFQFTEYVEKPNEFNNDFQIFRNQTNKRDDIHYYVFSFHLLGNQTQGKCVSQKYCSKFTQRKTRTNNLRYIEYKDNENLRIKIKLI